MTSVASSDCRLPMELPHQLVVQALDLCRAALVVCDVREPGQPLVYANPAFYTLTGFSAGEALGRDCGFLHGADTEPRARAEIRRAVSAGESCTIVLRNYRRDGSAFWNRLSLSPIRDAAGAVTHYVGMQEDVSEHLSKDHSLQLLLDAHGVAADSGSSFIKRCIDEALSDHLLTGRHHALLEVRVRVASDSGDALDPLRLDGIAATVATHLRNLIPARASMSWLSGLRFAVIMPLIGAHDEAEMTATGVLAELPIPLEYRSQPIQV